MKEFIGVPTLRTWIPLVRSRRQGHRHLAMKEFIGRLSLCSLGDGGVVRHGHRELRVAGPLRTRGIQVRSVGTPMNSFIAE